MTMRRTMLMLLCLFMLWPVSAYAIEIGREAPDFKKKSSQGQVQLSEYEGRKNVVLALYFAVFTPVWKEELLSFQRDIDKFEKLDAQVVGVSDDSLEKLEKFESEYGITFPLVSDVEKDVRKLYGWGRRTYLIDKQGIVRFMQKGVPDNEKFLQELKKLSPQKY